MRAGVLYSLLPVKPYDKKPPTAPDKEGVSSKSLVGHDKETEFHAKNMRRR